MLPIVELRGAIPVAEALNLSPITAYTLAVLGNLIPMPFVLWFARPMMEWLKKRKLFSSLVEKLEKKTDKNRERIMKYSALGLCIFVAIPLPGTGAWSGALAASIMNMRFKYAFPSIALGVIVAGLIMCFGTQIVQWFIQLF